VVSEPIIDSLVVFSGILDILVDLSGVIGLSRSVPGAFKND
jgi:hypothetical protein